MSYKSGACLGICTCVQLVGKSKIEKRQERIKNDALTRIRSTRNSRNTSVNVKMIKTHVWRFEIRSN